MRKTVLWVVFLGTLIVSFPAQAVPEVGAAEPTASNAVTSAPVCREDADTPSCTWNDPLAALVGPGENCCQRHLEQCSLICDGAIGYFSCGSNGRGGCWSSCSCTI